MSYTAVVAKIQVRPHPSADRLQLGTVLGSQVVVGLDTEDGELGIFFPTDGQLSEPFVEHNHLYSQSALDKLGKTYDPKQRFGFFSHQRKVRAQKFRGEKSDGFWCPLSYLLAIGPPEQIHKLRDGDTLTEFNGVEICRKYYTPATLRAMARGQKAPRRDAKCFPKHDDTTQFRFVADTIPDDAVIYITEKLHGTSMRFGHVMDDTPPLKWWQRAYASFARGVFGLKPYPEQAWTYLNGSRNVILEKTTGVGYYGTNEFRYNVVEDIKLHKGEVLYGEIVGWVGPGQAPIMQPQDVAGTNLKEIQAAYGGLMLYSYGCPEGEHRLYIYKIAHVNEDGVLTELPWTSVVRRCAELGLPTVPQFAGPVTMRELAEIYKMTPHRALRQMVEELTDGPSSLDSRHIREGVVVRVESVRGIQHIKNKSFAFGVLEGYIKEKDEYVDTEEAA